MDEEKTTEIANKWMEIADTDGNGTIDGEEFKDMIVKLDENISED